MAIYDRGEIHRPNRQVSQFVTLDAAFNENFHYDVWQGKYDLIISPTLLMQAGVGRGSPPFALGYHETHQEGVSTAFDEITRVRFDAAPQDFVQQGDILVFNANLTYFKDKFLGGAHDVKFGAEHRRGKLFQGNYRAGDVERRYQSGNSYRVIAYNTPVEQIARNYSLAGYVQDSIRVNTKLTVNLGLRTEWWRGDVPEQSNAGGAFPEVFGPVRTFPEQKGVIEWTTFSPRLGAAYDVTGSSRVVLKASYGRYFFQVRTSDLNSYSNANALATATYDWADNNRNNVPDFPSEFGTLRALNLPRARFIDPDLESPYTDEVTASVEFGLTPLSSFATRYTYRKNNKIIAATDLALPDSAFSIPSTAIDPLTGDTLNYWSLGPEYATVVNREVLTQFDNNFNRYHGVDFIYNRRFDGRWLLMASMTLQDNYGRIGNYLNRNEREIFAYGAVRPRCERAREDRQHVRAAVEAEWQLLLPLCGRLEREQPGSAGAGPQGPGSRRDQWHALSAPGRRAGQLPPGRYEHLRRPCVAEVRVRRPRLARAARRCLQLHQRQQHSRDGGHHRQRPQRAAAHRDGTRLPSWRQVRVLRRIMIGPRSLHERDRAPTARERSWLE